ncbi:MAG: hypothetical protein FWH03_01855 [Firmicutes bacterium]|nr:hypothetical protein [Bacillota bacterium]
MDTNKLNDLQTFTCADCAHFRQYYFEKGARFIKVERVGFCLKAKTFKPFKNSDKACAAWEKAAHTAETKEIAICGVLRQMAKRVNEIADFLQSKT